MSFKKNTLDRIQESDCYNKEAFRFVFYPYSKTDYSNTQPHYSPTSQRNLPNCHLGIQCYSIRTMGIRRGS
ncbi:hypothetical protein BJ165DRAFT_1426758 [Panaeolus papilionaceus]|nr:hypothetical protein BJ165DRAFT_1426758 [Panaeolus papilionaceus]